MIIDLRRFVETERPFWSELDVLLRKMESQPDFTLSLEQAQRLHYLYERSAADLARLATFSAEPQARRFLESLVGRAYGEIYETRRRTGKANPWSWLMRTFPSTVRRQAMALWLSVAITLFGTAFGAFALWTDPESKEVLMPFSHLQGDPRERVAEEEKSTKGDKLSGRKSSFSAELMTHNTRVAIFTMATGITYGIGTFLLLFYNGVILGAVGYDYIHAGQSTFLMGWLLPHGVIEIPAILLGGQAGLLLASALIGWGDRTPLGERMRRIGPDVVTITGGAGLMLIWAGIVESFFSQYHQPVIPYGLKIGFGLIEFTLLTLFLWRSGREAAL